MAREAKMRAGGRSLSHTRYPAGPWLQAEVLPTLRKHGTRLWPRNLLEGDACRRRSGSGYDLIP